MCNGTDIIFKVWKPDHRTDWHWLTSDSRLLRQAYRFIFNSFVQTFHSLILTCFQGISSQVQQRPLTFIIAHLVCFDSCSRLESAFHRKTSGNSQHSACRHSAQRSGQHYYCRSAFRLPPTESKCVSYSNWSCSVL